MYLIIFLNNNKNDDDDDDDDEDLLSFIHGHTRIFFNHPLLCM